MNRSAGRTGDCRDDGQPARVRKEDVSGRGWRCRGAAAAAAVASRSSKASRVPTLGRVAYLAASETEVALIKTKSGAPKMKVTDEALARASRGARNGRTEGRQADLPPARAVHQRHGLGAQRPEDRQEERQGARHRAGPKRHLIRAAGNLGRNVSRSRPLCDTAREEGSPRTSAERSATRGGRAEEAPA